MKYLFLLLLSFNIYAFPLHPDIILSPSKICLDTSEEFTEYRYPEHIAYCARNVSSTLKNKIYENYGIPLTDKANYTIDHIIPLSIGGSNDVTNLWPEHLSLKKGRGNLENDLYLGMRDGKITQKIAIEKILRSKFSHSN